MKTPLVEFRSVCKTYYMGDDVVRAADNISFSIYENEFVDIVGKSGSGKSFATKTILTNLAAENSKIFILDPENEYEILCHNLGGKIIDVGNSTNGIFNPFHIYATLESEEDEASDVFSEHLQFMEQFFVFSTKTDTFHGKHVF